MDDAATIRALTDADPHRRRACAIALGETGDAAHVAALAHALAAEREDFVAASFILALGAIGGGDAIEILKAHRPAGDAAAIALRKSLGRLKPKTDTARWKNGLALDNIFLEVPEGLERPATLLLIKDGWPSLAADRIGLLKIEKPVAVVRILPAPRWCYGARILLAEEKDTDEAAQDRLLAAVAADPPWRRWLEIEDGAPFPYRFRIEGRNLDKRTANQVVARCRAALAPAGGIDNPSAYAAEIVMSLAESPARIYFRPTTHTDERFFYRKRDVGAAMNPVVAALLARLAPPGLKGAIIDPVCGSGVPLIERRLFDPDGAPLIGIDISTAALDSTRANVEAAGMTAETRLIRGDARDAAAWQACGFVIANLPYGLRVKAPAAELDALYLGILRRAEEHLTADGRCVVATAYKLGLERALKAATKLRLLARYRVQTGGLHVHIAVLGRR